MMNFTQEEVRACESQSSSSFATAASRFGSMAMGTNLPTPMVYTPSLRLAESPKYPFFTQWPPLVVPTVCFTNAQNYFVKLQDKLTVLTWIPG
ncbi:hypothetical protein ATANTOWER_030435 [Ataeniobius toweri]|uniref:Uncharacterized protein n=1 Tax=Ataeniobius toweri TaxID=208326 RepID=A0ABU7BYH9_9TELE|nr:hypothetical protein [Ataeniobius toweri]